MFKQKRNKSVAVSGKTKAGEAKTLRKSDSTTFLTESKEQLPNKNPNKSGTLTIKIKEGKFL